MCGILIKQNTASDCINCDLSLREKLSRVATFLPQVRSTLMNFYRQELAEGCQKLSKAVIDTVKGEFWFNSQGEEENGMRRGGEKKDERNRLIRETLQQPSS